MPPSPPLTRRSTTSPSGGSPLAMQQSASTSSPPPPQPPPHATLPAAEVHTDVERPASQVGSNASLKEIRKVGKTLGQNPIDYLLPNGSLVAPVSAHFHPTHDPHSLTPPPPPPPSSDANPVAGIFGNLNFLLNSYLAILEAGGSLAVGTGYQSVARKVLERVENLFTRNLGVDNVGWADILEYLRGSRQKPSLFILPVRGILARREPRRDEESVVGGGEALLEPTATTRELAESVVAGVKVKPAMTKVEQWLQEVQQVLKASGPEDGCSPSGNDCLKAQIDDEEDQIVCEIVEGILRDSMEDSESQILNFRYYLENRALISNMRRALTRLYRDHPPEAITAPIVALYLLLHPELHPLLQALANISDSELELINSGKFDGFLDGSTNVVGRDEDEELAIITNLDTRLRSVLEGLETEIEELHNRALVVRRALKSRKECIVRRRPPTSASVSSRSGSPAGVGGSQRKSSGQFKPDDMDPEDQASRRRAEEEEWMLNVPTLRLPITPDDSASNISFNRRRRQERANKVNREDEEQRHKEKERKREKKEKKAEEKEKEKEKEKPTKSIKEEKSPAENKLFSWKNFSIKSGEFGPGAAADGDKSDDGDTMTSKRKKRREREGGESRRESHRERERERSRNRERCAECGSCVNAREHDKKEGKKHKDKKEERALKDVKEEKEKERERKKEKTTT